MTLICSSNEYLTETADINMQNVFNNVIQKAVKSIRNGKTSNLEYDKRQIDVFLQTKNGTFPLSRILDLQEEKIEKDLDKRSFILKGNIVDGEYLSAEDYGLKENCVINVVNRIKTIEILVNTLDRRTVKVEVNENDGIINVVKKIQRITRFNVSEHRLEFKGTLLEYNYETVRELKIVEQSVINIVLQRGEMKISLKTFNRENVTIELEVMKSDRIRDVKKTLEWNMGWLEYEEKMKYGGKILEDYKTVEECGLIEGSVINVEIRKKGEIEIHVEIITSQSYVFSLLVNKSLTVEDLKIYLGNKLSRKVEEIEIVFQGISLTGIDSLSRYAFTQNGNIQVFIRLLGGGYSVHCKPFGRDIFLLPIDQSYTILDVKKKIEEELELPVNKQILKIGEDIQEDDNKKVFDYYTYDESLTIEIITKITIFISGINIKHISLDILNNDKIIDIKKKIEDKIGVWERYYILKYREKILKDELTVQSYNIENESIIIIEEEKYEIKIIIKMRTGESFTLKVTNNNSISDVKKKIEEKIKVKSEDQILKIKNFHKYDYERIFDGAVIDLIIKSKIIISIFTKEMETIPLEILNVDTVETIKKKIKKKIKLFKDDSRIVFEGELLNKDDAEAYYYNIDNGSILEIIERKDCCMLVFAQIMDGRKIAFEVFWTDEVIEIKKKIEHRTGIPASEQVLKLKGNILRYERQEVRYCDICDGSIIEVSLISKMTIFLSTDNMETIPFEILQTDRIIDIKKKIEDKFGMLTKNQILIHQGEIITYENMTSEKCQISDNDDIIVNSILSDTKQESKGICLIINNENFTSGYKQRIGTQKDEDNIKSTFESIGYKTKIHRNITSSSVDQIIKETKEDIKRSHRMLIVFVLSHGENNGIIFTDGAVVPFEKIWKPFNNKKCPKLTGKPKLIFFACCRGKGNNEGVETSSDSEIFFDGPSERRMYPSTGDIFLGYAACHSYRSCRKQNMGTFYIQKLCEIIRSNPLWSISDIHQEVQSQVSNMPIDNLKERQMPCCENMLTKHAYFVTKDD